MDRMKMESRLKILFQRVFKTSLSNGRGSFLFYNQGYSFLYMFKDKIMHGLSCLALILGYFGPKIREIGP